MAQTHTDYYYSDTGFIRAHKQLFGHVGNYYNAMSLLYRSIYLTLKGWKTAKKVIAELESTKHLKFTHDVVPAIYLPWFPTLCSKLYCL